MNEISTDKNKLKSIRKRYLNYLILVLDMSVRSQNFSLNSKSDEQYSADERNNNVKNGQNSNKSIEASIETIEEITHRVDLQLWSQFDDDLQLDCKNNEKYKMEYHSADIRSNDSHSNDSIDTTKTSSVLNFSVDNILSNVNVAQVCNRDKLKSTGTSIAIPKSTIADDFNRIHRPMPMRFMSGSNIFQGNHKNDEKNCLMICLLVKRMNEREKFI